MLACLVFLTYRQEVAGPALAGLVQQTADMVSAIIGLIGLDVTQEGSVISHSSGFAYEIYYRCTGILPAVCLAVSILAHPTRSRRSKLVGLALGIPLLVLLNLVRLVHLFLIGVYSPGLFDVAHTFAWEGVMIAAVVALWLVWRRWAENQDYRNSGCLAVAHPLHKLI